LVSTNKTISVSKADLHRKCPYKCSAISIKTPHGKSYYPLYNITMTVHELHLHHTQRPFEPFRLLVADGRSYEVRHPERLASLRNGRMISVATDAGFVILDLLLITGLEKPVPGRHRSRRRAS